MLRKRSRFRRLKPEIGRRTIQQSFGQSLYEAATNRSLAPDPMADIWWADAPQLQPPPPDDDFAWPMSIRAFQEHGFLEPGDVLLTTKINSFFSFLVRTLDNGAFAHAALVFLTPKHRVGVDRTYFLQTTFGGVDLEGFSKIVAPSKRHIRDGKAARYVVGVKRLEAPWVTPAMRNMVSGRMLRFINDDNYNFSLLAALATPVPNFFFWLRDSVFGRAPSVRQYTRKKSRFAPVEFICSGFVQYAYVDMLRVSSDQGLLNGSKAEEAWNDVFFANWVTPETSMEELIAVKPAELADSPKLQWKYLIFGGLVYRVRSTEEADELMRRFEAQRKNITAA
jgi:hypothetical protein